MPRSSVDERARAPTPEDAVEVVQRHLNDDVEAVDRFPNGLAHYVFDVRTKSGGTVVVRMGLERQATDFAHAVYWDNVLAPRGVPLPRILAVHTTPRQGELPWMLMERLPGRDLADEYPDLTSGDKQRLAKRMAEIQQAVGALPHGPGFGYARSYDDSTLHVEWIDVLLADLERSRRRIQAVGAIDPACVDQVTEVVEQRRASLGENQPVAFLHDATTKNVLIHERTLSGIVDVDTICFGDPLLTLALTQMSLLKGRLDTEYVTHWHEALSPGPADEELLTLYTTVFCVNFLGELGQRFNKAVAPTVDPDERRHLLELLAGLLTQLGA